MTEIEAMLTREGSARAETEAGTRAARPAGWPPTHPTSESAATAVTAAAGDIAAADICSLFVFVLRPWSTVAGTAEATATAQLASPTPAPRLRWPLKSQAFVFGLLSFPFPFGLGVASMRRPLMALLC